MGSVGDRRMMEETRKMRDTGMIAVMGNKGQVKHRSDTLVQ